MFIPIVVIHVKNSDYLLYSLFQAKKSNPQMDVILIGDASTNCYNFIVHEDLNEYSFEAKEFAKIYKHYNNQNSHQFELFCFQRWFILKNFTKKHRIEKCLYIDSDVMLYANVLKEQKKFADFDLTLSQGMSPHCVFINNTDILEDFCDFLIYSYTDSSVLEYLEITVQECIQKNIPYYGVCDMNLFKVFKETGIYKIGEISTMIEESKYDHNISVSEGFEMQCGRKNIYFVDRQPYCKHIASGKEVKFNALHFQGQAKKYMKDYLTEEVIFEEAYLSLLFKLRNINLIIFPNWCKQEELLSLDLKRVMRAIATHPNKSQITLLIDSNDTSEEDANLILSGISMSLLVEENLDITEKTEISLVGCLGEVEWEALLRRISARIVLENENKQAIARIKAENLPLYGLEQGQR